MKGLKRWIFRECVAGCCAVIMHQLHGNWVPSDRNIQQQERLAQSFWHAGRYASFRRRGISAWPVFAETDDQRMPSLTNAEDHCRLTRNEQGGRVL